MRQRILSILFVVIALIVIAIVYKYDLLHIQSKNIQSSIIKTVRVDKVDLSNSALIIPLIGRVNANQSVFSSNGQHSGFIPKEEPAVSGLEEILSKYKKN